MSCLESCDADSQESGGGVRRASRLMPISCSQSLLIVIQLDSFDHRIALRVERDGADRLPVACMPTPARRVSLPGAFVHLVSGRQDLVVMLFVSCRRAHVANAAVQVRVVVPVHELRRPVLRRLQISKAARRELGPVLGRAEQRLDKGVVIAHARTRVRGLDAEPVPPWWALSVGAGVAVQHGFVVPGG